MVVGAAMLLVMLVAGPAFAAAEFSPNEHAGQSCGLGRPGAQEALADQTSPGATENALAPPSEAGCTGP